MKKSVMMSALLMAGLLAGGQVLALEFSQSWFFGDSLSDSGAFAGNPDAGEGGKFTTNPGSVWAEVFARRLGTRAVANNPENPRTDPLGTNYAQGGAQVTNPMGIGQTPSPQNALPIRDQVSLYLDRVQGRADRHAIYSVWGGANDLFFNMGLVNGGLPLQQALANMSVSADQLVAQSGRLKVAGARYLIMPLLPDVGGVPAWVLETLSRAGEGNPAQGDALLAAGIFNKLVFNILFTFSSPKFA
jgi:outer membrane lipase/esterase